MESERVQALGFMVFTQIWDVEEFEKNIISYSYKTIKKITNYNTI